VVCVLPILSLSINLSISLSIYLSIYLQPHSLTHSLCTVPISCCGLAQSARARKTDSLQTGRTQERHACEGREIQVCYCRDNNQSCHLPQCDLTLCFRPIIPVFERTTGVTTWMTIACTENKVGVSYEGSSAPLMCAVLGEVHAQLLRAHVSRHHTHHLHAARRLLAAQGPAPGGLPRGQAHAECGETTARTWH
jgi:hypothetical protein